MHWCLPVAVLRESRGTRVACDIGDGFVRRMRDVYERLVHNLWTGCWIGLDDSTCWASSAFGGGMDGVGVRELHQIEREQFVHFVDLARATGDPSHWLGFRCELLVALNAAYGLDSERVGRDPVGEHRRVMIRFRAALDAIDGARDEADPMVAWATFREALWERVGSSS